MTKVDWWSKAAAPAFAALMALSCGSSPEVAGRPDAGTGGAAGSIPAKSDAGDAMNTGGAGGISGSGGASSSGGTGSGGSPATSPDAGPDLPPVMPDAAPDVVDAGPPDLPVDRTQMPDVPVCPADCTKLPHVRVGAYAPCYAGVCQLQYGACEAGFDHCSATPNIGCETDLSQSANCGACGTQCSGGTACRGIYGNSYHQCLQPCQDPTPAACDFSCVNLQTDPNNCGTCGHSCDAYYAQVACRQGNCVVLGCTDPTVADCTTDPGCETTLGSDTNCGGCNDPSCTLANTMFTCSDGLGCTASVCAVGFANCNASSPDCETAVATTAPAGGGCVPQYVGTVGLATQQLDTTATALAADGSFFIAGTYSSTVDFDPSSAGKDIRTARDVDGYVTKFNANGSYAWTVTLDGRGDLSLTQLAIAPGGGVIAGGSFQDTIDLDPSAAQDIHFTTDPQNTSPFVVELAAGGTEVWGRTFDGTVVGSSGTTAGIAVDATGAIYVAGSFGGTFDLDPGAGTDTHVSQTDSNAFLVKLTSSGTRTWSRVLDNPGCSSTAQALTVATDGAAWVTGGVLSNGSPCALTPPDNFSVQTYLLKVDAAGDPPTIWTLGPSLYETSIALAPGRDGAIYVGGVGAGDVDLDPGPGVARRWLGGSSGFVLKLAGDGTYQWSRSLSGSRIAAMAPGPDGGVLAIGASASGFVSRLSASGASLWTIPTGNAQVIPTSGSANATAFAIGGTSSGTQDFDPGPAIDLLFGDIAFVSRFNF